MGGQEALRSTNTTILTVTFVFLVNGGDDGPLRNDILLKLIFEVWIMINDD